VLSELDPGVGLRYRVELEDGTVKTCVLLAHGYPVIFFPPDTHGAPNRAMDPVMSQLLLAAGGLPDGHASLDQRVYSVDDLRDLDTLPEPWTALVDEEALLRRWCHHNHLDPHGYLRRIGFPEPYDRPVETSAATAGAGGQAG
jgi:hypothetical protein